MIHLELDGTEIVAVHFEPADGLVEVQGVPSDFLIVDTKATYFFENGDIKLK